MERVGLPSGGSTLMTSAPSPASVRPQYSACSSAISMTRMPVSEPGCAAGADAPVGTPSDLGRGPIVILTAGVSSIGELDTRQLHDRSGIAGRQHRSVIAPYRVLRPDLPRLASRSTARR